MQHNKYIKNFTNKNKTYHYLNVKEEINTSILPYSLIVLYENYLMQKLLCAKNSDNQSKLISETQETISFMPHRILMQDYTAIPLLVDWLAFYERILQEKSTTSTFNLKPSIPIDVIIDHSLQSDKAGTTDSYKFNLETEYKRNQERFKFLKWIGEKFNNINIIPPGNGICHQINLESLSQVVISKDIEQIPVLMSENIIGTDSHTTMINGLSIVGWGVGGLEAESVMLGEPIVIDVPKVIGILLKGKLDDRVHITEVALYLTEKLRMINVVGKFLEFIGPGIKSLTVPHRATLANMTPEYGATCSYFPIENQTLNFLRTIGKTSEHINCVEKYAKLQGLWYEEEEWEKKKYEEIIEIDLATLKPSVSGPKRPQDRINLNEVARSFTKNIGNNKKESNNGKLKNGDIVIASITSCTNTSNPEVIFAAALLAKRACEFGLTVPSHVKTSFSPGSTAVERYLTNSDLMQYMERLGFNIIGYGCATCSGNSGDLKSDIEKEIIEEDLTVCSVLSGNRNFEGRIHRLIKANYLASPPLVIAYALMGSILKDLDNDIFGRANGKNILLKDIWPSKKEIGEYIDKYVTKSIFLENTLGNKLGQKLWNDLSISSNETYEWDENSTYIKKPPFVFQSQNKSKNIIEQGRILLILGDSITTDHISPVGEIPLESPAGQYLLSQKVAREDFNSLGSRRGNYEVMMRGAYGNIRIKNEMTAVRHGPYTRIFPENQELRIFDAAIKYLEAKVPLVVFAGKEYGAGSSRDWAAKGPYLLGIKCIIAESFERIHRSNLIGMGIAPFILDKKYTTSSLNLKGDELISIRLIDEIKPNALAECEIEKNGAKKIIPLVLNVTNKYEENIIKSGGIFNFCFHKLQA